MVTYEFGRDAAIAGGIAILKEERADMRAWLIDLNDQRVADGAGVLYAHERNTCAQNTANKQGSK